jgi:hypothetical protein
MSDESKINVSSALPNNFKQMQLDAGNTSTSREEKLPETFSFSSLNRFESCHYAYYLAYVKNVKVPRATMAMDIGSAFHKIAELYDGKRSLDEIISGPAFGSYQAAAVMEAREIFSRWFTPEKFKDIAVVDGKELREKWFEYPLEVNGRSVKIVGYIDAIKVKPGEVEIVDYKTGSSLYTHQIQLAIYSMPVFKENPQVENLRVTFDYVAEGAHGVVMSRTVSRKESLETEAILKAKLSAIMNSFDEMKSGIQPEKAFEGSPGKACRICEFTGACSFYQKYLASMPSAPDSLSADELEQRIRDISQKIELEQRELEEMQEALESKAPSRVVKYTTHSLKVKPSKVVEVLHELGIPPDKYLFVKSTLGSDLVKGRLKVSEEVRSLLLQGDESKIVRKLNDRKGLE